MCAKRKLYLRKVAAAIAELPSEIFLAIEAGGTHELQAEGVSLTLGAEDILLERQEKPGLFAECAGTLTVALDHELTEELLQEGLAREMVNRIQSMRKDADLHVADRIRVEYHTSAEEVVTAAQRHAETILSETLATELVRVPTPPAQGSPTDLNGNDVSLLIQRVETVQEDV